MVGAVASLRIGFQSALKNKTGVVSSLAGRISHIPDFIIKEPKSGGSLFQAKEEVRSLRSKLKRIKVPDAPWIIKARGTFFPCVLLSSGWWERRRDIKVEEVEWRDDIQRWLYHGFYEWAPSWDVSVLAECDTEPYLIAQLGTGDEAESLLVVIPGEEANKVRGRILEKKMELDALVKVMAFEAEVTGVLCHRKHLSKIGEEVLGKWGKAFDYCLWLDRDDRRHTISPLPGIPPLYSGYLWQCLAPKEWIKDGVSPELTDVFFIWEHTDFTKPDAVKYNLDSLEKKASYLEREHGDLVLLQKSSLLVPGDPLYPAQEFYNFMVGETYRTE